MTYFAYFIGGPLDLTKKKIDEAPSRFYTPDMPIMSVEELRKYRDMPAQHHEYMIMSGRYPLEGSQYDIFVYVYIGQK